MPQFPPGLTLVGVAVAFWGSDGFAGWFFILGAGLVGCVLSPSTELLIARRLPRLGGLPSTRARITTAAVTGALCAALTLRIGMDWSLPAFLALAVLAVQLARIDIAHHLLPNPLVLALLITGLVLLASSSAVSAGWNSLIRAAAGSVILFLVYLVLALVSPSGIGMGDVKLAAPVGLYLGYLGWSPLFYGGAVGFVLGGVVSVIAVAMRRSRNNTEMAFGPSMLAAALGVCLFAL